jgi:NDP-sugar pyrophosphorylase family protein
LPPPRALVLSAGLGTRLRPLTYVRAKAAMPVNGDPLVRRVVRWLAAAGIRDLVCNLHHRPDTITALLGDGADLDVRVRYSWEDPVLGSGGGPRRALPLLLDGGAERFLTVNGDTLTDVDVQALLDAHVRSGALVTMALIPNPAPDKYGGVLVDADARVMKFTRRGEVRESYHFIGVQAVEASVFADLPDGVAVESVGTVYPRLIAANAGSVRAFISAASFRDIGTPADLLRTTVELAALEGDRMVDPSAKIAATARVERSTLWDDVAVHHTASLADCIVGDGAVIPAGASFERCAIVPAQGRTPASSERLQDGLLIRSFNDD